jgi:hypothetical protein
VITYSAKLTDLAVKLNNFNKKLVKSEKFRISLKNSNRELKNRVRKPEQFISKRDASKNKQRSSFKSSKPKKRKLAVSSSTSPTGTPTDPTNLEEPLQLHASPKRKLNYSSSSASGL